MRCENPDRRRVVVVFGAGRSGTSTITRALAALGVELGDRLKPPAAKNPKGFFEDVDLLDLTKRAMRALGLSDKGTSVRLVAEGEPTGAELRPLREEAIATIRRRFGAFPLWGFKAGGLESMLPFWEDVFRALALEPSYVLALRNPLSVARSRARLDPLRGLQEKSDLEWLTRNVPPLRLAARRRLVVVDYDRIADDPRRELERIARGLELPFERPAEEGARAFAEEFLSPDLRHTRFAPEDLDRAPRAHPLARDAYRLLRRLALDELDVGGEEFRRDWSTVECEIERLAPVLRLVDRLEEETRRARAGLGGFLARLRVATAPRELDS